MPGRGGNLLLGGDVATDYAAVMPYLDLASPATSPLVLKPTNAVNHGGGRLWVPGSSETQRVIAWIAAGARSD
jgi:hypothetical protein